MGDKLVSQPTKKPTRKVQYMAVVGLLTYALTEAAARLLGAELPAEVAQAIPVAAGTLAAYVVRDRAPEGEDEV